ncbi:LOW QUALITY PROTEIN: hypothetical protein Cgig2_024690 [Carnegiea gigantea]|uniref:Uncharacterized protein n=1 Tax=Carnegiea gigantea TaxID=171969 RepID=A0A9Q1JVX8_9CARY|nr:LOW QUALITY PROTEIN: hypothetical protein Cgig2_024690 [Carnegiea gigantea]
MADSDERMQAEDATNSKNSTNDNMARKSRVTLTYKRKSRTFINEAERQRRFCNNQSKLKPQVEPKHEPEPEDEHEPETEPEPEPEETEEAASLHSLQPTLKRAPKRTPKKKVQFRHVNAEEPVRESTDLTLITTRSWSGLLRHRMAPGSFLRLVERLEYEQWSAIVEPGFRGIFSIRTKLILKSLARWLLEKYDPWDNSLNLANGKLLIDEKDVYATLGLPMGEFELFYVDRVQFRGRKVERSFPVAINWDTDKVRNTDNDEQLSWGFKKGRIIERIDYQTITSLAEVDLDINIGQPHKGGTSEMSRARPSKDQCCPFCPHCNGQREAHIHVNDDPIQSPPHTRHKGAANENVQECISPDDAYYYSPEFLEQLDKLEGMAKEEIQHRKRVTCSPPSFSLRISLEQKATPAPSAHPTPGTDQVQ